MFRPRIIYIKSGARKFCRDNYKVMFHQSLFKQIKSFANFGVFKCRISDWTLNDVVKHLLKDDVNQVMVMAGAGISVPSGIPDFRTPGCGLYDNLQKYNLPYPEAIFDIEYFRQDPRPFYKLAKEIYPGNFRPNAVHNFCKLLHLKNKLLRMYTQNIDGLERAAGIPTDRLVEAHGTFHTARCTSCNNSVSGDSIKEEIMKEKIPKCNKCQGVLKPEVVFFGENLPERFHLHLKDVMTADTLIILGTSLEVQPFASLADLVEEEIPRILINKTAIKSFITSDSEKDVLILGDIEENIKLLADKLGWTKDLEDLNKLSPT